MAVSRAGPDVRSGKLGAGPGATVEPGTRGRSPNRDPAPKRHARHLLWRRSRVDHRRDKMFKFHAAGYRGDVVLAPALSKRAGKWAGTGTCAQTCPSNPPVGETSPKLVLALSSTSQIAQHFHQQKTCKIEKWYQCSSRGCIRLRGRRRTRTSFLLGSAALGLTNVRYTTLFDSESVRFVIPNFNPRRLLLHSTDTLDVIR